LLKDHFIHEGRIKEEHALSIIEKATEIFKQEETLLEVDAPITGINFIIHYLFFNIYNHVINFLKKKKKSHIIYFNLLKLLLLLLLLLFFIYYYYYLILKKKINVKKKKKKKEKKKKKTK